MRRGADSSEPSGTVSAAMSNDAAANGTSNQKMARQPRPCTARNAITIPADGAMAHNAVATPKIAMPTSSMRLRPKMSPIRPAGSGFTVSANKPKRRGWRYPDTR